jgi:hypothetical protein
MSGFAHASVLQRKCSCGGGCSSCAGKRKRPIQRRAQNAVAPEAVYSPFSDAGQPLPKEVRKSMEGSFGFDFSRVRIHSDASADRSADSVNALAYTLGNDIVFSSGAYQPSSANGQSLLAHELAHVVQQDAAGPVVQSRKLQVSDTEDPLEREAESAARQVADGQHAPRLSSVAPYIQRVPAGPYISQVAVNLSSPESATLTWSGTPPAGAPGVDSFTVSTGKGYSDPGDDPGTCTRTCCTDPDTQCAAPYNRAGAVGSCCTPIGTFWTGVPQANHGGWLYWTPVEPIHSTRGIALHQHDTVTGQAIGHGCIRMDSDNAQRIYTYSRRRNTAVVISGAATVLCANRCASGGTGALETPDTGREMAATNLTRPDEENAGGGGGSAPEVAEESREEVA